MGKSTLILGAWGEAVALVEAWMRHPEKADQALGRRRRSLNSDENRRVQRLFYGVLRHLGLLGKVLERRLRQPPRPAVEAILLVAGFEILDDQDNHGGARLPAIVDHAVEGARRLASAKEAGMVNAVLRRFPAGIQAIRDAAEADEAGVPELAIAYSHPEWLVRRWIEAHGRDHAIALMQWNQSPAPVYVRLAPELLDARRVDPARSEPLPPVPTSLAETSWSCYRVFQPRGDWREVQALVDQGLAYVQDPLGDLPLEGIEPKAGGNYLDLCAAPGGKATALAERLAGTGARVVAVDRPGGRIQALADNLRSRSRTETVLIETDATRITPDQFRRRRLPESFDGVIVDAPCSNTGVLRRRADARWRLEPEAIGSHAALQGELLRVAAAFVKVGGRLVYATCSLEPEENAGAVEAFLADETGRGFKLSRRLVSFPPESGHDGGAAFVLTRLALHRSPPS